ncbi:hypothetical protein B0H12DRAFT_721726 [Mycena haematopus]|nr:hypothetical protein B0H12DRAFT_721726 [Mycena haematopus]
MPWRHSSFSGITSSCHSLWFPPEQFNDRCLDTGLGGTSRRPLFRRYTSRCQNSSHADFPVYLHVTNVENAAIKTVRRPAQRS